MSVRSRERVRLLDDEVGGMTSEYLIVLVLVAIVAIVAWVRHYEAVRDDADVQYQEFGYPAPD
ncbi:MAG: hypothetical protein KF901_03650 [Myxococcales bacterium]|nr:hypothetical protein [Myxococcales bacterium]